MSFRMKRLDEIEREVDRTFNIERLEDLRREAHDIWRKEHDFGIHDKDARAVYNKINVKLDELKRENSETEKLVKEWYRNRKPKGVDVV